MAVVIGGVYEHYKGNQYKIIAVAKHSETLEKLIVYQALYGDMAIWVRPYQMFCDKISKDGKEIDRFKFLGDELESEYAIYIDLPEDLKQSLYENNISIESEIMKEVDNLNVRYEQLDVGKTKKDISLVILATGASVAAVLLGVAKLIRVINERPRVGKIIETDLEKNILREETILLEPYKVPQKMEIDFEIGTKNIRFRISDEND